MTSYSDITDLEQLFDVSSRLDQILQTDPSLGDKIPDLDQWLIAGKITAYLLSYGRSLISNGVTLLFVYQAIDARFKEIQKCTDHELLYAFPINISLDDCAAHYTPTIQDETVFSHNVVKLDLGISVNGCIGDSAITIDLSFEQQNLVQASKEALKQAIVQMKPGNIVSEVGKTIEQTILSFGLNPIRNLSGHRIQHYTLHSGKNIPNFNSKESTTIEFGEIYAVEPFATTGAGLIQNAGLPEIFRITQKRSTRSAFTRQILQSISIFRSLPFSRLEVHLLSAENSPAKINFALKEMRSLGMIDEYAQLMEVDNGLVSQHEHTIIVGTVPIITTTLDETAFL